MDRWMDGWISLKNIYYFRPLSRRQENTSSKDKSYLCELLWTVSPWLLSMHSKRYSRPNFPHKNHHGVKPHDWQLSWLMSVLIGQTRHPTALFPRDITMDTLAANDFNRKRLPACTATGPGSFTLVQVATSYPSLSCVNRIISTEISPPLH